MEISATLPRRSAVPVTALGAVVLLSVVGALVTYKATASLGAVAAVTETGALPPRVPWIDTGGVGRVLRPLAATANYVGRVWIALLFGVLIAAAVRAFVPARWFDRALGGGARGLVAGGLLGAPLMLCSCCVAPVFDGVYRRTGRLAPALALLTASPALNPFAIAITFLLFPASMGVTRLVGAAALVFVASAWVARVAGETPDATACAAGGKPEPATMGEALRAFLASARDLSLRTVPVILLGVLISLAFADLVPLSGLAGTGRVLAIALVALVAVPLALPTFAELPLGAALLAAGAPPGAVVALLVAGPSINLPSLLTIRSRTSGRAALAVAASVAAIAFLAGLAAEVV
jgi:hypothetical protein